MRLCNLLQIIIGHQDPRPGPHLRSLQHISPLPNICLVKSQSDILTLPANQHSSLEISRGQEREDLPENQIITDYQLLVSHDRPAPGSPVCVSGCCLSLSLCPHILAGRLALHHTFVVSVNQKARQGAGLSTLQTKPIFGSS